MQKIKENTAFEKIPEISKNRRSENHLFLYVEHRFI